VFFADANSATTYFTMPNNDAIVTALFEEDIPIPEYFVVLVVNGIANGFQFEAGQTVTITAEEFDENEELNFVKWTTVSQGVVFTDATSAVTTFEMPANYVMVIANYVTHKVKVIGGTGSGDYVPGETVTINANEIKGSVFKEWTTSNPDIVFADSHSAITTFIMLNAEITIEALFEEALYFVTVVNGIADMEQFKEGDIVTLTADIAPSDSIFYEWTSEDGIIFTDANAAVTTFTMPSHAVTVTATYTTVGINENNAIFSLYPNPTTGQFRIANSELQGMGFETMSVEIFDGLGRQVFPKTISTSMSSLSSEIIIDISHLANGIYFVKFNDRVVKVVKQQN
jgi:hypothetical protein